MIFYKVLLYDVISATLKDSYVVIEDDESEISPLYPFYTGK